MVSGVSLFLYSKTDMVERSHVVQISHGEISRYIDNTYSRVL
jgi:hypothetical protein